MSDTLPAHEFRAAQRQARCARHARRLARNFPARAARAGHAHRPGANRGEISRLADARFDFFHPRLRHVLFRPQQFQRRHAAHDATNWASPRKNSVCILTLHGVIYGVSKFLNGFLADRANARVFMAVALFTSALLNVWFGFSSAVLALGNRHLDAQRLVSRHGFSAVRAAHGQLVSAETIRHKIFHLEYPPTTSAASGSFCSADFSSAEICSPPTGGCVFSFRRRLPLSSRFCSGSCCPTRRRPSACRNLKARTLKCRKKESREDFKAFVMPAGFLQQIYLDALDGEFFRLCASATPCSTGGRRCMLEAKHIKIARRPNG